MDPDTAVERLSRQSSLAACAVEYSPAWRARNGQREVFVIDPMWAQVIDVIQQVCLIPGG